MIARILCIGLALGTLCPAFLYAQEKNGAIYTKVVSKKSYSQPFAHLSADNKMNFILGRAVFRKLWVSSPSSTTASDGLGPLHNARACRQCHVNNGRGRATESFDDPNVSMIARLSIKDATGVIAAHPLLGGQLQQSAVQGLAAEGDLRISWQAVELPLQGELPLLLRKPVYDLKIANQDIDTAELLTSFRIAPPLQGMGLLDAIPAQQLLERADPDDHNKDGISGRVNRVLNPVSGQMAIGRFGWKAGQATLAAQNASALNSDLGLSNDLFENPWGDCGPQQVDCRQFPHGNSNHLGGLEVAPKMLRVLNHYTASLAVPLPRSSEREGLQLFNQAGCESCHRSSYKTDLGLISPYSDMLLHDMGEALADGRAESLASGREWRTAPLWGIGLAKTVNPKSNFLHDGRARTLLEAVMWHGGEAESAKRFVQAMSVKERLTLIQFLESL